MQKALLARRLSNRLATNRSSYWPANFATAATTGREEKEKDAKIQTLLKLLAPAPKVDIEISDEDLAEWERRAKQFSSLSMKAHREYQRDLGTRLQLKKDAIAALPPLLQVGAVVPFEEPFPLDRMMFSDTPPRKQERKQLGQKGLRLGTKQRT